MNEKCKYCDYVSKCSKICEYNSVLCKLHRNFPKTVDKSYEQLQQENQQLKEEYNKIQKAYESTFSDYQQLKDNWDKLKEIIKKKFVAQGGFTSYEWNDLLNELLDKMQEMEKNYGNVEGNT